MDGSHGNADGTGNAACEGIQIVSCWPRWYRFANASAGNSGRAIGVAGQHEVPARGDENVTTLATGLTLIRIS
jgi:hypothetical protein